MNKIYESLLFIFMDKANESKGKQYGIGNILRLLRIIRDLTVKELAQKMDLTSSYICDVESNRKKPSLDMLERYSDALGVNRSTLLFFDEEGKKIIMIIKKCCLKYYNY